MTARTMAFALRIIQDALSEASAVQWDQRAATFEAAAHQLGIDWPGHATRALLAGQRGRCLEIAQACRNRAAVERWPEVEP